MAKAMAMDVRDCEAMLIAAGLESPVRCVDCGTSFVKALTFEGGVFESRRAPAWAERALELEAVREGMGLIVTGARSAAVSGAAIAAVSGAAAETYSEMECLAALAPFLGLSRAVVACVGTGTPFVVCEGGAGRHFGGTGVGGGTFVGLGELLLGERDPQKLEEMAARGEFSKVNILIGELDESGVSYLKNDYTASNFGKGASGGARPEDVSAGIHSLVSEAVGMMAAQIGNALGIADIVFCGAVLENAVIQERLQKCMDLFSLHAVFLRNPGFGVCYGALAKSLC